MRCMAGRRPALKTAPYQQRSPDHGWVVFDLESSRHVLLHNRMLPQRPQARRHPNSQDCTMEYNSSSPCKSKQHSSRNATATHSLATAYVKHEAVYPSKLLATLPHALRGGTLNLESSQRVRPCFQHVLELVLALARLEHRRQAWPASLQRHTCPHHQRHAGTWGTVVRDAPHHQQPVHRTLGLQTHHGV